jgi:hypothetical protein
MRRGFGEHTMDSRLRGNDGVFGDGCVTSVNEEQSPARECFNPQSTSIHRLHIRRRSEVYGLNLPLKIEIIN